MADKLGVIAEIVPKGDFPVVSSENVQAGGKRLDVALTEAAAEVAKKVDKTYVDAEVSKKASTEYVNAELSKKADKTEVAAELVTKANKIDVETALSNKADSSALRNTNEALANVETEQDTLSARMDTFTNLPEGSTTGDAELADIRVGADGKTYANAGAAVRGQVTNITEEITNGNNNVGMVLLGSGGDSINISASAVGDGNRITTITFPNDSMIFDNNGNRYPVAGSYQAVGSSTGAYIVYFNTESSSFESCAYNNDSNQRKFNKDGKHLKLCTVRSASATGAAAGATLKVYSIEASFPYTLNANNDLWFKSKVQTIIADSKGADVNNDYKIIIGLAGDSINISNYVAEGTKRTIRLNIPKDTVIVNNKSENYILNNEVYDVSGPDSGAVVVYFDTKNQVFLSVAYNNTYWLNTYNKDTRYLKFCAIRSDKVVSSMAVGTELTVYSVDASFPYTLGSAKDLWFKAILESIVGGGGNYIPLSNTNIKSVNHRGYNSVAPENTLPAFALSAKVGFKYVECDVLFTSDNVPVLLHDFTIDRTSNGSGNIADMTYEQALQYDFGSWKSSAYAGTKIPTFEQFIAQCKYLGLHPYVELKDNGGFTQEKINMLIGIVEKYGMLDKCTWISFSYTYLSRVCTTDNKARIGLLANAMSDTVYTNLSSLKSATSGEVFLDVSTSAMSDAVAENCKSNGIPIEVWTITSSSESAVASIVESSNAYISGYTTDVVNIGIALYNKYAK